VCELETQLLISQYLKFISEEVYSEMIEKVDEIQKMIYVFEKRLNYQV
jgi:four helix bundle protein